MVYEVYMVDPGGEYIDAKRSGEGTEEILVAWASHPLFHPINTGRKSEMPHRLGTSRSTSHGRMLTGRLDLPLYYPPIPDIREILHAHQSTEQETSELELGYNVYNDAVLILHIYGDNVQPRGLPFPVPECRSQEQCPQGVFIAYERKQAPTRIFKSGMGFDLYIDDGRFFPACCVVSKVHICLYNERFRVLSEAVETNFNLDTDTNAPVYDERFEFREPAFDPSSTLLFTVTFLDSVYGKVSRLGLAALPVFVKPGTFTRAESSSRQFCLNEGAFQLRLYRRIIEKDVLNDKSFDGIVPCSTLLVRIVDAVCHQDGEAKKTSEFPKDEWEKEGLLQPKGLYSDGYYESLSCIPTSYECRLYHSFLATQPSSVRKAVRAIAEGRKTKTDQGLLDWLTAKFKGHLLVDVFDLSCLTSYNSDYGIVFCVEKGQNLPWNGFTFGAYCLSPPASFFKGTLEDPAVLVTGLDLEGEIRQPRWDDGLKVFPRRQYHPNLLVIVQLYEMAVDSKAENTVIPGRQAWTMLPVCSGQFSNYGVYQVGLFHEAPSPACIEAILNNPLDTLLADLRRKKLVKTLDGASVFLRLGDARRQEDLKNETFTNRSFLPKGNKYINVAPSRPMRSFIPAGQSVDDFSRLLKAKFKAFINQMWDAQLQKRKP